MKNHSTNLFFTILLIIGVIGCSDGNKVHLRLNYIKDTNHKYIITASMQSTVGNDSLSQSYNSNTKLIFNNFYNKVYNNGECECKVTVDSIDYKSNSMDSTEIENSIKVLKQTVMTVKMSPYGDFLEIDKSAQLIKSNIADLNLTQILIKVYPILPHSGMRIGETWDRQQQFDVSNMLSKGTLYLQKHFKLLSVKNIDSRLCAQIHVDMTLNIGIKKDSKFKIIQNRNKLGKGEGTIYFDIENGCYYKASSNIEMSFNTSMINPVNNKRLSHPVNIKQNFDIVLMDK